MIEIDNKVYESIALAQKEVGVSETTIRRRLRDPKYPTRYIPFLHFWGRFPTQGGLPPSVGNRPQKCTGDVRRSLTELSMVTQRFVLKVKNLRALKQQ